MTYIAIKEDTCVCVYPKVGSMSIHQLADQMGLKYLNAEQALGFENRIAFIREPIERIQSVFNHFYHLRGNGRKHQTMMPVGTISGYGAALELGKAFDFGKWSDRDIAAYEARVAKMTGSKSRMIAELQNEDYKRFIDFVLSVASDEHLIPQRLISMHKGEQVANKFYKFEDINEVWEENVKIKLPHVNSWPDVEKDKLYRIDELVHYFRLDYSERSKL